MPRRATDGASLEQLLALAVPLCNDAQGRCPRTGPGRKPIYQDWQIAALIVCGVLKKKKSIGAQFNFIHQNKDMFLKHLDLDRLPGHGTFYDRYKRVHPLVKVAIELQGRAAIREHVADARDVAVDKSLMAARGAAVEHHGPQAGRGAQGPAGPGPPGRLGLQRVPRLGVRLQL